MKQTIILAIFGITLLASASFTIPNNSPITPEPLEAPEARVIFAQVSSVD